MTLTPSIRVPLTGMDAYLSIFGANGRNLSLLEGELGVTLAVRGSDLEISGGEEDAALAARVVDKLMDLSARGAQIDRTTLRYAAKLARQDELDRLDESVCLPFFCDLETTCLALLCESAASEAVR